MSKANTETITCPACQTHQSFVLWNSVNVTLDPTLRDKLRSGELTTFHCAHCGHTAEVVAPLLYHDMDKCWMFWLVPDGKLPKQAEGDLLSKHLPGYCLRLVRSRNELLEKLTIFDASLDDRLIAVVKLLLRAQLEQHSGIENATLFFDEWTHEPGKPGRLRFAWVGDDKVQGIEIPGDLYENAKHDLAAVLDGAEHRQDVWIVTDDHYAAKLMAQRK